MEAPPMNMIEFLFGEPRQEKRAESANDYFWSNLADKGLYAGEISPETAISVTAVYTCVRIIAESVSTLPVKLFESTGKDSTEQVFDDPLALVLRKPNAWMTKVDFWEYMINWVAMRGNSFARKIMSNGGDLLQLIPLDTERMNIEQKSSGELIYDYRLLSGQRQRFSQADIFHIRGLPFDGVRGISPLAALQRTLKYQLEMQRYGTAFFKNNAQPGGKLEHPGKIGDVARQYLQQSIAESYTGENVGKTMILEEGMKFNSASINHSDLQFVEIAKLNKSDVYSAFRMPPHMAGDLDKATFSNIEHQSLEFVKFTLMPWLVRTEEAVWRDLIPEAEKKDRYIKFQVNGLLRGDQKSRYESYVQGLNNGFLNADEVRSYEDLNPIPDGSGQIYRAPLNLTSSDQVGKQKQGDQPGGTPSTPGSSEPVANRSRVNELFLSLFKEQYGRLITREEKTKNKTEEWRAEHKQFIAESLQSLLVGYVELYCQSEGEKLRTEDLKARIASFAAETDSQLSNKPVTESGSYSEYKISALWGMIKTEINNALGDYHEN